MKNSVFVTGISGFVASHIALQLLKGGAQVTGSVRSKHKAQTIRNLLQNHGADISNLKIVELDLLQDAGWSEAINGHDYLIHTASPFVTTMPKDPQELIRPAVQGTKRAIEAGLAANVKRIVLTSSVVAIIDGHDKDNNRVFTEMDWTNTQSEKVPAYAMSKTIAEEQAWQIVEAANKREILSVINPGFIFGPILDEDIGTSGEFIKKMLTGGFPGSPDIYFTCVDVRDVAALHIDAMENMNFFGRRCIAANPSIQMVDLAKILAKEFPSFAKKLPTNKLPDFLFKILALFRADARGILNTLGRKYDLDTSRAKKLLGRDLIAVEKAACDMAHSILNLEKEK